MNLFTHFLPADGGALLAGLALKGSLILLLAFLVTAALSRISAATRHAVWVVAMGAVLLLPVLFVTLPGWEIPVLPGSSATSEMVSVRPVAPLAPVAPAAPRGLRAPAPPAVQSDRFVIGRGEEGVVIERFGHTVVAPVGPFGLDAQGPLMVGPASGPSMDVGTWLLLIWLAGVGLMALRWMIAVLAAWRLVQNAEPIYDLDWLELKERIAFGLDLDRPVRLLRSDRISVPIAGGVFDPVVVLPADSDTWTEDRREVVLTHELAHIVRYDCVTQLLAQGALAIHWFNPLAWLGFRRFMLEREHACDDFVLNNGARASDYADHLVQIARRFRGESLSLAATAPMARRSNLEGRILSILDPDQKRDGARPQRMAAFGLLGLALVAPLAALEPVEIESEPTWQSATVATLAPMPSVAVLPMLRSRDDTFTWEGRVGSGGFVEVYGLNGEIRARTGSGDRVRVEAEKSSDRGGEDEVEIVVREFANGVVLCAIYPGQRDRCEPGEGPRGNVRDNDVQVAFDIVLPENVRFIGRTVNGSIKTGTLGADVDVRTVNGSIETGSRRGDVAAKTVNGSITADAGGFVDANTTNGSIKARLGRVDWDGRMAFETTNGSITLELPDDADLDVHAEAGTGSIKSDFPIPIRRDGYVGASAKGKIGDGGRLLHLQVLNGSIKLKRHSAGLGALQYHERIERERSVREQAQQQRERLQQQREQLRQNRDLTRQEREEIERAFAEIGPAIQLAMDEAGRAMAAVDFEGEIARAMNDVDWIQIEAEVEQAFAEAAIEMEAAFAENGEVQREVRHELKEALADVRNDLDELCEDLAEVERESARASRQERAALEEEKDRLESLKSALQEAERELKRALND